MAVLELVSSLGAHHGTRLVLVLTVAIVCACAALRLLQSVAQGLHIALLRAASPRRLRQPSLFHGLLVRLRLVLLVLLNVQVVALAFQVVLLDGHARE